MVWRAVIVLRCSDPSPLWRRYSYAISSTQTRRLPPWALEQRGWREPIRPLPMMQPLTTGILPVWPGGLGYAWVSSAGEADQDWGDTVNHLRSEESGADSQLLGDRAWGFATGFTVLGVAVARFTHTQSVLDGNTLRSRGLQTWDVAATFVQSLPPDDLIIGVSARYIRGTAYSEEIPSSEIPESEQNVAGLVDRGVGSTGRSESRARDRSRDCVPTDRLGPTRSECAQSQSADVSHRGRSSPSRSSDTPGRGWLFFRLGIFFCRSMST